MPGTLPLWVNGFSIMHFVARTRLAEACLLSQEPLETNPTSLLSLSPLSPHQFMIKMSRRARMIKSGHVHDLIIGYFAYAVQGQGGFLKGEVAVPSST